MTESELYSKIYKRYIPEFLNDEDSIYKYETIFVLAIFFITGYITATHLVILNSYNNEQNPGYNLIEETIRFIVRVESDVKMQMMLQQYYGCSELNLDENEFITFYERFLTLVMFVLKDADYLNIKPKCFILARNDPSFYTTDRMVQIRIIELIVKCMGYNITPIFPEYHTKGVKHKLKHIYVNALKECNLLREHDPRNKRIRNLM